MSNKILKHEHLIIRALLENPPKCPTAIKFWMENLVETIDMKILMGPYAVYSHMPGNMGLTAVTIIETSHIALHIWDEVSPALMQLDVYTCSDLEIDRVFQEIKQFSPSKLEYKYIDRENDLTLLKKGSIL